MSPRYGIGCVGVLAGTRCLGRNSHHPSSRSPLIGHQAWTPYECFLSLTSAPLHRFSPQRSTVGPCSESFDRIPRSRMRRPAYSTFSSTGRYCVASRACSDLITAGLWSCGLCYRWWSSLNSLTQPINCDAVATI